MIDALKIQTKIQARRPEKKDVNAMFSRCYVQA